MRLAMSDDGLELLRGHPGRRPGPRGLDAKYEGTELTVAFNPEYLPGRRGRPGDEVTLETVERSSRRRCASPSTRLPLPADARAGVVGRTRVTPAVHRLLARPTSGQLRRGRRRARARAHRGRSATTARARPTCSRPSGGWPRWRRSGGRPPSAGPGGRRAGRRPGRGRARRAADAGRGRAGRPRAATGCWSTGSRSSAPVTCSAPCGSRCSPPTTSCWSRAGRPSGAATSTTPGGAPPPLRRPARRRRQGPASSATPCSSTPAAGSTTARRSPSTSGTQARRGRRPPGRGPRRRLLDRLAPLLSRAYDARGQPAGARSPPPTWPPGRTVGLAAALAAGRPTTSGAA